MACWSLGPPRDADFVGGLGGLAPRAASIVALSAGKVVCSATEVISLIASPIRVVACDSALIRASVSSACCTALAAMRLDSWTCAEIPRNPGGGRDRNKIGRVGELQAGMQA